MSPGHTQWEREVASESIFQTHKFLHIRMSRGLRGIRVIHGFVTLQVELLEVLEHPPARVSSDT
jgi:hypothetical protein